MSDIGIDGDAIEDFTTLGASLIGGSSGQVIVRDTGIYMNVQDL